MPTIIKPKRLYQCEECHEIYDHRTNAEECCREEPPEPNRVSRCGCGAIFQGWTEDSCPECKRKIEIYQNIMGNKSKEAPIANSPHS